MWTATPVPPTLLTFYHLALFSLSYMLEEDTQQPDKVRVWQPCFHHCLSDVLASPLTTVVVLAPNFTQRDWRGDHHRAPSATLTLFPHLSAGCWAAQPCALYPQGWPPGTRTGPRHGRPPAWCEEYQKTGPRDGDPGVTGCPHGSRRSLAGGNRSPRTGSPPCGPPGLTGPVAWPWIGGSLGIEKSEMNSCPTGPLMHNKRTCCTNTSCKNNNNNKKTDSEHTISLKLKS